MSIFGIFSSKKEDIAKPVKKRSFIGAAKNRYTDWINATFSKVNGDLLNQQEILLTKCRSLAKNNPLVRAYLGMAVKNVIGKNGIVLQSQLKNKDGELDQELNDRLEWAWFEWGKKANGFLTVDGQLGHSDFDALILRSLLVDGEAFIRIHRNADNPYGLSFELIDALSIDFTKKKIGLTGQGSIINGIEIDKNGKPTYYYIAEGTTVSYGGGKIEKIPASEMIHIYKQEFPISTQTRGIPPLNAVMNDLKQLEDYRIAELMAAKTGACLALFYERNSLPEQGTVLGDEDDPGVFVQSLEPGMATVAPTGYNVKSVAPAHPNADFDGFNKAILKQVASSLGVSYNKLCKDYAGVNYSSLREGALDEQAYFQEQQSFLIESWKEIELKLFLESLALHTDIIKPSQTMELLRSHSWAAVKRAYFDKSKDLLAEERAVALGIKSPIELIYENGEDPDEVLKSYALWQGLCEKYKLNFKSNNDADLPSAAAPDDDTNA